MAIAQLTVAEMREPLPVEVAAVYTRVSKTSDFYGGHGGSHAYLAHEFIDAIAHNCTWPLTFRKRYAIGRPA